MLEKDNSNCSHIKETAFTNKSLSRRIKIYMGTHFSMYLYCSSTSSVFMVLVCGSCGVIIILNLVNGSGFSLSRVIILLIMTPCLLRTWRVINSQVGSCGQLNMHFWGHIIRYSISLISGWKLVRLPNPDFPCTMKTDYEAIIISNLSKSTFWGNCENGEKNWAAWQFVTWTFI